MYIHIFKILKYIKLMLHEKKLLMLISSILYISHHPKTDLKLPDSGEVKIPFLTR
jgi:hypothetical protein